MIRSAVFKLTFAYLAIIMALSIGFSLTLYHISDNELNRGLRRPGQPVFRETSLYNFDAFRDSRLNEGRQSLKSNLILLNIITFGAGFAASYLLARRTLEPIAEAMDSQMRFTADASHELRTPLTAMQTEIEVALRDKQLSQAEARALLTSNLEEVERLRQLSDGLLQLAQQKSPKLTATKASVYEAAVAAQTHVAKQIDAKQMSIVNQIDEEVVVRGDASSLANVLAILLDNACKYSNTQTTITLSSETNGNHVIIRVKDQGGGIDKADVPYVFDRFYRADAARTKQDVGGYGLGLSIAKQIVDLHRGSIEVEKTSKKGTTFAITLHKA